MVYSHEVEHMCVVKKGPNHGPAPIPEEGKWVQSKDVFVHNDRGGFGDLGVGRELQRRFASRNDV